MADASVCEDDAALGGRVAVFYHLCAVGPAWEGIARDQLSKIRYAGLYARADTLEAHVSGPEGARAAALVREHGGGKWGVVEHPPGEAEREWERLTLRAVHAHALDAEAAGRDGVVLYLHSKGVTHAADPEVADRVRAWREAMEWVCVGEWRSALRHLALLCGAGGGAAGMNARHEPWPHLSGNFWWATTSHLAALPSEIGPAYLDPERWIGRRDEGFLMGLADTRVDHYKEAFPLCRLMPDGRDPTPERSLTTVVL